MKDFDYSLTIWQLLCFLGFVLIIVAIYKFTMRLKQ